MFSRLMSSLSVSCSTAIGSTSAFSSTLFIGPRHDEVGKESSHVLLQPTQYRNYITNGEVTQPLFGLGTLETIALIKEVKDEGSDTGLQGVRFKTNVQFIVLISFTSRGVMTDLAMHFFLRTMLSRIPKDSQANLHLLMSEMCGYWRYLFDLEITGCSSPLSVCTPF